MATLFGSRVRGNYLPESDWDVFLTDDEIKLIPGNLLISNGGKIDAFEYPGGDGWARAVGDDERMLLVYDGGYSRVDAHVEISFGNLLDAVMAGELDLWHLT